MSASRSTFSEACRFQARLCEAFGSPFSAVVLDVIADDVGRDGPFAGLAAPWADADVRRITADAAEYFHLPRDRTVIMGSRIEL